jgi:hypothetical protein
MTREEKRIVAEYHRTHPPTKTIRGELLRICELAQLLSRKGLRHGNES